MKTENLNNPKVWGMGNGGAGPWTALDAIAPAIRIREAVQAHARQRPATEAEESAAKAIGKMAERCAFRRARRLEALGWGEADSTTATEFKGIYRARFARAWSACGAVPEVRAVFSRDAAGAPAVALPFRVRLAWARALRRGAAECQAELWRTGQGGDGGGEYDGRGMPSLGIPEHRGRTSLSRVLVGRGGPRWRDRSGRRRALRAMRVALVVHWVMRGGQRWQSSLAADLSRLCIMIRAQRADDGAAVLVAAGMGLGGHDGGTRRALLRLAERVTSGDQLATVDAAGAESALCIWETQRGRSLGWVPCSR